MALRRSSGILSITVDLRKAENMLNNTLVEFKKVKDLAPKKVASMYAEKYLKQMDLAGGVGGGLSSIQRWTGRSFNVLRRQIVNPTRVGNGYGVVVPLNLVFLDMMDEHEVKLKIGRPIQRWAKRKLGLAGGAHQSITVHPHPWIRQANAKARRRIRYVLDREIRKAKAR